MGLGYGRLAGTIYGLAYHGLTLPGQQASNNNSSAGGNLGGSQLGDIEVLADGSICQLVQVVSTSDGPAANAAMAFVADNFQVDDVQAENQYVHGCNDKSSDGKTIGSNLVAGEYFWMTIKGFMYPLVVTTVAALTQVSSDADADGTLSPIEAAADEQLNIMTLVSSGSGGPTKCYKD